ncbi:MAG: hypothetical protein HQL50_09160 [Magnetococcales bacterium]|nr:hypothetical protein [Magnetococcales bacterium]
MSVATDYIAVNRNVSTYQGRVSLWGVALFICFACLYASKSNAGIVPKQTYYTVGQYFAKEWEEALDLYYRKVILNSSWEGVPTTFQLVAPDWEQLSLNEFYTVYATQTYHYEYPWGPEDSIVSIILVYECPLNVRSFNVQTLECECSDGWDYSSQQGACMPESCAIGYEFSNIEQQCVPACAAGYSRDQNGKCLVLADAQACPSKTVWSESQQQCMYCQDGSSYWEWYEPNQICMWMGGGDPPDLVCPYPKEVDLNTNTCVDPPPLDCPEGQTWQGTHCSCPEGKKWNGLVCTSGTVGAEIGASVTGVNSVAEAGSGTQEVTIDTSSMDKGGVNFADMSTQRDSTASSALSSAASNYASAKAGLLSTIGNIKTELTGSFSPQLATSTDSLPCFSADLTHGTIQVCFEQYRDSLATIGQVILFASMFLAALILFK